MNAIVKGTKSLLIIFLLFIGIVSIVDAETSYAATINEVEPNDTQETATVINVGDVYSGEIGSYNLRYNIRNNDDDDDYIRIINCVAGKTYTVVMTNYTYYSEITPDNTLLVRLQYPNGTDTQLSVYFERGYGGHYYSFVAPTSGDYYLHLSNYTDFLTKTEHYYTIGMFEVCDLEGHIWGSYTVTKKATYAAVGSKSARCEVCGKVKKATIPKLTVKATAITKLTPAKKAFTVKWKKCSSITGYEIQYALNSKFTKNCKTKRIAKANKISKKITKLKAKKKYYVRVRAYKTYKGKKYYSKWSKVKKVVTKK